MNVTDAVFSLDIRELAAFAVFVLGAGYWFFRLESGMKEAKRIAEQANQKIDHTEDKLEDKMDVMRQENIANFAAIDLTLKEVIFRLGEKSDRREANKG